MRLDCADGASSLPVGKCERRENLANDWFAQMCSQFNFATRGVLVLHLGKIAIRILLDRARHFKILILRPQRIFYEKFHTIQKTQNPMKSIQIS